MSCGKEQQLLQDYANQELASELHLEITRHLAGCESCRNDVAIYRLLDTALPNMPEPVVPEDLAAQVVANIYPLRARPQREAPVVAKIRSTVKYAFAVAFMVTLGASLWGWLARIVDFTGRNVTHDIPAISETAKDLWYLLRLLVELISVLRPTAQSLWVDVQRSSEPVVAYGPLIAAVYLGTIVLGAYLCWRALSYRGERGLTHAS
jgi:Putative zinc-finger